MKEFKKLNIVARRKKIFAFKKNAESFKLLCKILKTDPSPVIRHEAAFVLGNFKEKRVLPHLFHSIKKDKSDLVRHEAIEALADVGIQTKSVQSLLKKLLKDKNPFIKDTAQMVWETLYPTLT